MKKYGGSKKMYINMALLAVLVISLGYYIYQGSIIQEEYVVEKETEYYSKGDKSKNKKKNKRRTKIK